MLQKYFGIFNKNVNFVYVFIKKVGIIYTRVVLSTNKNKRRGYV